jgi:pimeloyl-ACP methyl ester carboxylesterase
MTSELKPTRKSDADLQRLALEGNEDACATLYNSHRTKLLIVGSGPRNGDGIP